MSAVRDLTGVPIDHFAEIHLAGFYDLTDALGGVEVCLNQPVSEDYSGADFPGGTANARRCPASGAPLPPGCGTFDTTAATPSSTCRGAGAVSGSSVNAVNKESSSSNRWWVSTARGDIPRNFCRSLEGCRSSSNSGPTSSRSWLVAPLT